MTAPVTAFSGTAALYALMLGNTQDAEHIVAAMPDHQRAHLAEHLERLLALCRPDTARGTQRIPCGIHDRG